MSTTMSFKTHHTAISVRNLDKTREFYEVFGYRLLAQWEAADQSLKIAHLGLPDGGVLELFEYASNHDSEALNSEIGNDLSTIGVKHFGLHVDNLEEVHRVFEDRRYDGLTPIQHGRTRVDYFFVRDPDGIWAEVVQDDRELDPGKPMLIKQES